MDPASEYNPSPTGAKSLLDTFQPEYDTTCRKIGGLDVVAQFLYRYILVPDVGDTAVNDFSKVVGHHISGHTHRNPGRPVNEQLGDPGRQYSGFFQGVVKVQLKINRIFINVLQDEIR